jgi:cytochrome c
MINKMKRIFVLMFVLAVGTFTISSCGGKKEATEEKKDDGYSDYETADEKKASPDDLIKQGEALVNASDCKTCHHPTNKIIGPAHGEVAKKYEFTQANVTMLANKIIKGGAGVWGEIPMTAHPDLSLADAEKMSMYVLSLDGEKPKN